MLAGGRALDERRRGRSAPRRRPAAEWIDYVGPVGAGREAGVALMPLTDRDEGWWFVSDWGVITWGPFRRRPRALDAGNGGHAGGLLVAHDGDIGRARLRALRDELPRATIDLNANEESAA